MNQVLNSKLKALNNIPSINNGGCGIVAYHLAKHIRKVYKCKAEIVYFNDPNDTSSLDKIANKVPDACLHAMVRVNRKYYDSEGSYTLKEVREAIGIPITTRQVSLQYAKQSYLHANWNPNFDRIHITSIQQILKD